MRCDDPADGAATAWPAWRNAAPITHRSEVEHQAEPLGRWNERQCAGGITILPSASTMRTGSSHIAGCGPVHALSGKMLWAEDSASWSLSIASRRRCSHCMSLLRASPASGQLAGRSGRGCAPGLGHVTERHRRHAAPRRGPAASAGRSRPRADAETDAECLVLPMQAQVFDLVPQRLGHLQRAFRCCSHATQYAETRRHRDARRSRSGGCSPRWLACLSNWSPAIWPQL